MSEDHKRAAGLAAAQLVHGGMRLGLGTGSTAHHFTVEVGRRVRDGEIGGIAGVPTSRATAELALEVGIPTIELEGRLDLAVDGADEVASDLSLIKGGGGALLREKIVASAADRFVVIVDDSKLVPSLGTSFHLPVEIARFGFGTTIDQLARFGTPALRGGDHPAVTDNGNYIVDLDTGPIGDPRELDHDLSSIAGVLATGLFVELTDLVIAAGDEGLQHIARSDR